MKKLSEIEKPEIIFPDNSKRVVGAYWDGDLKKLAREWIAELEKERKIWETNKQHQHCLSWEGDVIDSKIEFIKEYILEEEQ